MACRSFIDMAGLCLGYHEVHLHQQEGLYCLDNALAQCSSGVPEWCLLLSKSLRALLYPSFVQLLCSRCLKSFFVYPL